MPERFEVVPDGDDGDERHSRLRGSGTAASFTSVSALLVIVLSVLLLAAGLALAIVAL